MFTGLIEGTAEIKDCRREGNLLRLAFHIPFFDQVSIGDSVACDGVCLTVTGIQDAVYTFEVMKPTREGTLLDQYRRGRIVNVELDGHIVQGHCDGIVEVTGISRVKGQSIISFSHGRNELVVEKGSVAVNGISLTVYKTSPGSFQVGVIPHTWENTSLKNMERGSLCHVEYDIIGKYILNKLDYDRKDKRKGLEEVLEKW